METENSTLDLVPETDDVILPEGWSEGTDIFTEAEIGTPTTEALPSEPVKESTDAEDDALEETETPPSGPLEGDEQTRAALENEVSKAAPKTDVPEAANPTKIRVKYNHQELEYAPEDAAPLIQKGLNYDKVVGRLDAVGKTLDQAEQLAKRLGYASANDMLVKAEENYLNAQIKKLTDEGVNQTVAEVTVKAQRNEQLEKERKAAEEVSRVGQERQIQAEKERRDAEIQRFIRKYPGVTKLPDSVKTAITQGASLVEAYSDYLADAKQKELNVLKQNQEAEKRAPVTGTTTYGTAKAAPSDSFMEGFDSEAW